MSMSATRRTWAAAGLGLALALGAGLGMLAPSPVSAAPSADSTEYVKYYTVTSSYQGAPETLTEIATRFLSSASRSSEIFSLNSGRAQPDGGVLTDPAKLHTGWSLVLPWDAVGEGVQYGLLPTAAPAPPAPPAATPTKKPGSSTPTPKAGSTPTPTRTPAVPAGAGSCTVATASSSQSDWASLRLAPDQAWAGSNRGKGQLVAVIDSGADGSLPQLTGHVTEGADIVAGSGRGDSDCLGTGTAMAGLIVAQPTQSSALSGVAPDATVMPVRVVATSPHAQPEQAATAIEVATSAGSTVIAIGSYVDVSDARVATAIAAAASHDVVVVIAAPSGTAPVDPSAPSSGTTVRVAGVAADGQGAAQYRAGAVDVVAPGVNVTTLGVSGTGVLNGTGTQYAVAFVAGEAALVRAAYPDLTAAQVVHRLEATADKMGDVAPDSRYGYGMINPGQAVSKSLPEEARSARAAAHDTLTAPNDGSRGTLLIVIGLVGLAAAALLVLRIRRLMRAEPGDDGDPPPDGPAPTPVPTPPAAQGPTAPAPPEVSTSPPRPHGSLSERLTAAGIGHRPEDNTVGQKGDQQRG